jgi:hypothetical protein
MTHHGKSGRAKRKQRQGGRKVYRVQQRYRATNNLLSVGEKYDTFMKQNADSTTRLKKILDNMKNVPVENIRIDQSGNVRFPHLNEGLKWLIEILPQYDAEHSVITEDDYEYVGLSEAPTGKLTDTFLRKAFKECDITHSYTGLYTMSYTHKKFLQVAGIFARSIDDALKTGKSGKELELKIISILEDRLAPENYQQKKPVSSSSTGLLSYEKSKRISKQVEDMKLDEIHCEPTDARVLASLDRGIVIGEGSSEHHARETQPPETKLGALVKATTEKSQPPTKTGGEGAGVWEGAFGNDTMPKWTTEILDGKIGVENLIKLLRSNPKIAVEILNGSNYKNCYFGTVTGTCAEYFKEDGLSLSNFWNNNTRHLGITGSKLVAIVRDFGINDDDAKSSIKNYLFVVKESSRSIWASETIPAHGCHIKPSYKKTIDDAIGFIREKKGITMNPSLNEDSIPCLGYGFTAGGGKWKSNNCPKLRLSCNGINREVSVICPTLFT